jgi:competence protein ComEC
MDEDHINGIQELLEQENTISIGTLIMPDVPADDTYQEILAAAKKKGIPVKVFHKDMGLGTETWKVECLSPQAQCEDTDKNEASMVLAIQYGTFRTLLTGDLEGEGEEQLVKSHAAGKVSVLKVAHHGSKNSTFEDFLEETRPTVSVISCGKNNRYGHPAGELLERLNDSGTAIYETMEGGAITVTTDGGIFAISEYKKRKL